jgi:hypothetical protein
MRKQKRKYASVHDLLVGNEISLERDNKMGTENFKKENIKKFKSIIESDNLTDYIHSDFDDIDFPDTLESVSQVAWLLCNKVHKSIPSSFYMESGKYNMNLLDFFRKNGKLEYRKVYSLDDYPEINYIFSYKDCFYTLSVNFPNNEEPMFYNFVVFHPIHIKVDENLFS